jgi:hypothetical protein
MIQHTGKTLVSTGTSISIPFSVFECLASPCCDEEIGETVRCCHGQAALLG